MLIRKTNETMFPCSSTTRLDSTPDTTNVASIVAYQLVNPSFPHSKRASSSSSTYWSTSCGTISRLRRTHSPSTKTAALVPLTCLPIAALVILTLFVIPAQCSPIRSSEPATTSHNKVRHHRSLLNSSLDISPPRAQSVSLFTPYPYLEHYEEIKEFYPETYFLPESVKKEDRDNTTITIGYLTNIYGRHSRDRQGIVISGAIQYAVDVINHERSELLGGRQLKMIINDTSATSLKGTSSMLSQWQAGAVAFFGPEDTCEVEASVAGALNLPMISYKCANPSVSNKDMFPTFLRVHPPDTIIVRSVISLLRHYNWCKFAVVRPKHSEKITPVVDALRKESDSYCVDKKDFDVLLDYAYEDDAECCRYRKACCGAIWPEAVEKTYEKTRIYVFFGGGSQLSNFLLALKNKGVLENGEYMIISVELDDDYDQNQLYRYINHRTDMPEHDLTKIYEAAQSLFIIVKSPPKSTHYSDFVKMVIHYNNRPPFNFSDKLPTLSRHITYYAAYLYDSVMLYAEALSQVSEQRSV